MEENIEKVAEPVKKGGGTKWLAALLLVASLASIAGITMYTLSFERSGVICRDVVVSGVELGGLTKADAEARLRDLAKEKGNLEVTLIAIDRRWKGNITDLGGRLDWEEALDTAYAVGRKGSFLNRVVSVLTSGGNNKVFEADFKVDRAKVRDMVEKVADAVNRPHKDAAIKVADGQIGVVPQKSGIKLNEEKAADIVATALANGGSQIDLQVEPDEPRVTTEDLQAVDTRLATFTTSFNRGKVGRTMNLTLAAKFIDGVVLKPGDVLSVNERVGPRTADRGFKSAPIFVNGQLEPGLGGGVCQVSTTLYNAALLAGLKVVERAPHSRPVPYVSAGLDATVAYPWRDFKVRNDFGAPVAILAKVSGSRLSVSLYGNTADKKKIAIYTGGRSSRAAGSKTVVDPTLAPGARKVTDKGSAGVSVTVYRKVTNPDGSVAKQIVSRDRYPAQKAIVAVGPPRPAVPKPGAESPVSASSPVDNYGATREN